MGMWTSSIGIVGLALNLRAYDFVSGDKSSRRQVRDFHTKTFFLMRYENWMSSVDQPHENFVFEVLPRVMHSAKSVFDYIYPEKNFGSIFLSLRLFLFDKAKITHNSL